MSPGQANPALQPTARACVGPTRLGADAVWHDKG